MTEKKIKELRDKYKDGIPQEVIEQTAEKIIEKLNKSVDIKSDKV